MDPPARATAAAACGRAPCRPPCHTTPGGRQVPRGRESCMADADLVPSGEIIAPGPDQPEPSMPRPFGIDGVSHGGLASWALACDDIDAAVAGARSHGYDPGDVVHAQRAGPTGTVHRWRLTLNAMTGGPVPFLISWGDTKHPARSAPRGLTPEAFHIEHPDPPSPAPLLTAPGADVENRPAAASAPGTRRWLSPRLSLIRTCDRRGCAHPARREHLRIGWSKVSADVTQGELHVSSRGEAINAGWGACLDEKLCKVRVEVRANRSRVGHRSRRPWASHSGTGGGRCRGADRAARRRRTGRWRRPSG